MVTTSVASPGITAIAPTNIGVNHVSGGQEFGEYIVRPHISTEPPKYLAINPLHSESPPCLTYRRLQPPQPNLQVPQVQPDQHPPLVLPRPRIVHVPRRGCGHRHRHRHTRLSRSISLSLQVPLFALVTWKPQRHIPTRTTRLDTATSSSAPPAVITIAVSNCPDSRFRSVVSLSVPRHSLQRPSSELYPLVANSYKLDKAGLSVCSCQHVKLLRKVRQGRNKSEGTCVLLAARSLHGSNISS